MLKRTNVIKISCSIVLFLLLSMFLGYRVARYNHRCMQHSSNIPLCADGFASTFFDIRGVFVMVLLFGLGVYLVMCIVDRRRKADGSMTDGG